MAAVSSETEAGERPLISVIMIFLNEARFIEEAISSVLVQSERDWELLLIDDGSTDGSAEIARSHTEKRPVKVRYLRHPGGETRGTGPSRDLGLRSARGRYVAFLDADDTYLPGRLARHVEILERMRDIDVVQSYHVNWLSWQPMALREEDDHLQGPVFPAETILAPPLALINSLMNVDSAVGMDTVTIRRSAALKHGGFEVAFTSLFEDQAFLTKLYLEHTTYLLPECLARYRMHRNSTFGRAVATAHKVGGDYQSASRALANWQLDYFQSKGATDRLIAELLERNVRAANASSLRWRGWWMLCTSNLRRVMSRLLPGRIYRGLRRRRRVAAHRNLWLSYQAICSERARADLQLSSGET